MRRTPAAPANAEVTVELLDFAAFQNDFGSSEPCAPEPMCMVDGDCDDDDSCTDDACVSGECRNSPIDCDDGVACTDDACNPASGCEHVPNTAPCDDGDACTNADARARRANGRYRATVDSGYWC